MYSGSGMFSLYLLPLADVRRKFPIVFIPPNDCGVICSIDAEEAILGAILVSPVCMNKIVEHLKPESFYKPAHRYVYEAMLQLYNGEDKIDIVSVSDILNINQKLELVDSQISLVVK